MQNNLGVLPITVAIIFTACTIPGGEIGSHELAFLALQRISSFPLATARMFYNDLRIYAKTARSISVAYGALGRWAFIRFSNICSTRIRCSFPIAREDCCVDLGTHSPDPTCFFTASISP